MVNRKKISTLLTGLAAAALGMSVFNPATASAQDAEVVEMGVVEEAPAVNTGNVSLSLGMDIYSKYYFRGIIQEDQGVIAQPWAEIGFALYENEEAAAFNSLSFSVGIWNSFHSEQTGANSAGPDIWYEADLYASIGFGIIGDLSGSVTYTAYTSPNSAFNTVEEIALGLSYDDTSLWEDAGVEGFSLAPSVKIAFETDNSAFGPDEGIYLEVGIEPSFGLGDTPITLSFPVTVGLSIDDYYEAVEGTSTDQDAFGYVEAGIVAGMPLEFVPAEFGAWDLSAGVYFLHLGNNLEDANSSDDFEIIGKVGMSMTY